MDLLKGIYKATKVLPKLTNKILKKDSKKTFFGRNEANNENMKSYILHLGIYLLTYYLLSTREFPQ